MTSHPEHDLLSAYADGELDASERAAVDAHLSGCADARAILGAIRATLDDLALLGEPEIDPQVSFAVRGAIARERNLSKRGRRYAWATGAAAAALIGVVAFVTFGPDRGTVDGAGTMANAPLMVTDENYTESTVGSLLDALASEYNGLSAAAPAADSMRAGKGSEAAGDSAVEFSSGEAQREDSGTFRECLTTIERESDSARLVRSIAARYENEPVYLLLFEVPASEPKRLELWVVGRATCDIRYFRQEDL